MTDDKRRPTRRNVRSELDDLRDAAAADEPEIPEIRITTVAVNLPEDERVDAGPGDVSDGDEDVADGVGVTAHTEYDPETGEWVDVRDEDERDAITDP